jgi:hypothetical protein
MIVYQANEKNGSTKCPVMTGIVVLPFFTLCNKVGSGEVGASFKTAPTGVGNGKVGVGFKPARTGVGTGD